MNFTKQHSARSRGRRFSRSAVLFTVFFVVLLFKVGLVTAAPSLSVGGVSSVPGATVSVPVTFQGGTTLPPNVVALQADVQFDPVYLTLGEITAGTAASNRVVVSSALSAGRHRVLVYSLNNGVLSDGEVANLSITVSSSASLGFHPLVLTNVIMATGTAAVQASTNFNGYISLIPVFPRPDGSVDVFLSVTQGQQYIIQATTNFSNWVNLLTNVATGLNLEYMDLDAHRYPYRFYRAVPLNAGVSLGELALLPDRNVSFNLIGTQGGGNIIQASTNLVQWVNLNTNIGTIGTMSFVDTNATNFPYRFYRLQWSPR